MKKSKLIDISELPEKMQAELVALTGGRKDDDEEEGEEDDGENPFTSLFPKNDRDDLEERGIIILDKGITKQSISRISTRLLALHLDPSFNDSVQIILNSPGGYLDAMWSLIDVMDSCRLNIRTVANGEICSAATMIFVAGDERIMSPNSTAMIHHFSTWAYGTYYDLVAARKNQDLEAQRILRHFIKHSKYKTAKDIESKLLLKNDNWLSPAEMKKHGLCDSILKGRPKRK